MKKNIIINNLREIITAKVNTLDLDELRAAYFALLPITADPELKELLLSEPEPDDDEIKKELLPEPPAIPQKVQHKAIKEDLPAGTFATEDADELPTGEFTGGDEIIEPEENTLLEKVPASPVKKPELPKATGAGECWVITRSYGFVPDGPGYDITGDELVYGIYDSWGPAISEFKNISERTGKDIDEGPDYYKITDWNPATGTAGYVLKKHYVNGTKSDEDEIYELFLAAAAESAVLGMSAFMAGDLPELANEIANLSGDIENNVNEAKEILGDKLPGTINTAVETAKETLRQLIALMAKFAE